ncbi:MAG: WD40/YVTN/BNR-like repeat-containing protein, partial [Gemmatimonadaceae bacterium]
VWKTTDYGRTWGPLFDDQPTGSIGTVAVAPSDPNIVYVGSGEGVQRPDLSTGDGVYRSSDAGKTWTHLGLRDGQQIGSIIIDPKDPDRIFVAVVGHPYGPNEERGVFRSTDGGKSFQKVLYKDENTGAIALAFDPANAQTVYADMWQSRQAPWENGVFQGPGSGLYKSTDGGATWSQLATGLPTFEQGLGRIGFAIAPSNPLRMYAQVEASAQFGGTYRSDDAGASWRKVNGEPRIWGRGSDFAEVKVDPRNPDVIYAANTSTYRSTDAGASWTAIKGAPGGDDYHTVWINPDNSQIILLASDQGATITVNGGETWSSWYNQPTAQLYHVTTDNQFPYWVYGGQQESGSVGIASRGNDGQITFMDWHPVGVEEYGYAAPDPLDPNLVYGGKATRWDRRTGDVQNIAPEAVRSGKYRFIRTMPILFSPIEPHTMYLASQLLFKTTNGGRSWQTISPDLTRADSVVPRNVGVYSGSATAKVHHGGVIYSVGPSFKTTRTIWVGTDDGLIQLTRDGGKSWKNVTPPGLTPWSKVAQLVASHYDDVTAYAAINSFRLDDLRPHIFRTHDEGKSWTEITAGIPDGGAINTVREDPVRKGLLFAGSEREVFVSFDDGDHWQSLRLNMPASSVRDLVIHDDDIVAGTHGRSIWILDDITPLRQLTKEVAESSAHLFRPQVTYRIQRDQWTDTPLPPEEPAGKNPPDGAVIDYWLGAASSSPVAIEVTDRQGKLVRRFSSADRDSISPTALQMNVPTYWVRPPQNPGTETGMHRFVWDLHYPPPEVLERDYPISAIHRDTPLTPHGPAVLPGTYTVTLTVGGRSFTQPLVVKMDPRVRTPASGLTQRFALALRLHTELREDWMALKEVQSLREELRRLRGRAQEAVAETIAKLDDRLAALVGSGGAGRGGGGDENLTRLNAELIAVYNVIEGADATPTTQAVAGAARLQTILSGQLAKWREIRTQDLPALNAQLKAADLPAVGGEP